LSDRSRSAILQYADAIRSGQFSWFSYGRVQLGFPPPWNFDFVSGVRWPETKSDTIQLIRQDGSDVKVPWELSRLQFLPILGKAWRVSGENRYREAAVELLRDWIRKNPAGTGVNWTVAMEAALRAISICFALELLVSNDNRKAEAWQDDVIHSLWEHVLFIEAYNEFSHLARGNHYLSNILGLFCLASYLQGPGMEKRRRLYRQLLAQEMQIQVNEDGGGYEASSGYHLLNLQMFTSALFLMRAQKTEPAAEFTSRLRGMYRFLSALADRRGRVPHIGDCDDGRIELLSDDMEQMMSAPSDGRHSLMVSSALGIGEALFQECYGGRVDEAAWYGSVSDSAELRLEAPSDKQNLVFPKSGLAVARVGPAEVVFSAMPNGIHGKGSHTHNDKLSLIVRIYGEELFSDSGTGCYTRDTELRNRFRSTSAHNTVQIDGEEQNRFSKLPQGVFRIRDDAHVTPIETEDADGGQVWRASHDGYRRLGVVHTRIVRVAPQHSLTLEDHFNSSGNHTLEAHFHLRSLWQVELKQETGTSVKCRIQGPRIVAHLTCQAPIELEMVCLRAETSTAYGTTDDAKKIVVRGSFLGPVRLLSSISWEAVGREG
jgi:hypothetical protein